MSMAKGEPDGSSEEAKGEVTGNMPQVKDDAGRGSSREPPERKENKGRTMESHQPGSAQLAHILLHELFWRLVQIIPVANYSAAFGRLSGSNEFVKRFYRVLDENISSPLELAELSRKMAMSPSQLNKLCNRVLESSPASLVQHYKMTRACELLTGSDLSVREIGEMLGFRDQFSFSRSFKRQESLSPMQYRQQAEKIFLEE